MYMYAAMAIIVIDESGRLMERLDGWGGGVRVVNMS